MRTCSLCSNKLYCRGWCRTHYGRWQKWGDPNNFGSRIKDISAEGRLELYKEVDPVTGCWNWTGSIGNGGYGMWNADGKRTSAHRMQYSLIHGEVPKHLAVCHKCDNRRCFNPDHLFLGTWAENQRDMKEKGRAARGERNARSTLTAALVLAIFADPRPHKQIAPDYGISVGHVSDIKRGVRWGHLTMPGAA